MIAYTNCEIDKVSVHQVGNVANEEDIYLSKSPLDTTDFILSELLLRYFLKPFAEAEFYNFTYSNGDVTVNPLYNFAKLLFDDPDAFHERTISIARHLFEVSTHPNIKSGDLFVAKFSNIQMEDELCDAIGIFKSENRQAFLKLDGEENDFLLNYEDGINIDKLDKGCLIFNVDKSEGFKVSIIDKSSKSSEAQYWKDVFLNVKPCNDNYHSTKEFLNITKQFVTKQVSEEFDIPKADKIDMLNRSVDYFKSNESFDKEDFESNVFNNEELKESFRNFDSDYRENNDIAIKENFKISPQAVKKQSRAFKSVLKLDKNFHIYIHGDKNKIERGMESDGRKFYKIYYEEEK